MKNDRLRLLIFVMIASALVFSGCLGIGDDKDTDRQVTVGDAGTGSPAEDSPSTPVSSKAPSPAPSSETAASSPTTSPSSSSASSSSASSSSASSSSSSDPSDEDEEIDTGSGKTSAGGSDRLPVLVFSSNQAGMFDQNQIVFMQLKKGRTFPRTEVSINEGDVIRLRNMDDTHRTTFRIHSVEGFFEDRDLMRNYDMFIQFNKAGTYRLELYNGGAEKGELVPFSGGPSTLTVTVS